MTTGNPSFRDPDGQVLLTQFRAIRLVRESALPSLEKFLRSPLYTKLVGSGDLLPVSRIDADIDELARSLTATAYDSPFVAAFEQPRLGFVSYPAEWPAPMLRAAAELTIGILRAALDQGWGLKDATPFNVGFKGSRPVFLDILSFEERNARDPIWLPYGQFVRTFLLPLMLSGQRRWSSSLRPDIAIDGIDPEELYEGLDLSEKLSRPARSLVTIPALLSRMSKGRAPARRTMEPERARFILSRMTRGLERALASLGAGSSSSRWTSYIDDVHEAAYHEHKKRIVSELVETHRPGRLLDIGCNVGDLSIVGAQSGCSVVAIDADAPAVGRAWERARGRDLDILPLVVDIANPTPGRGWRNVEHSPFLERAKGAFEMVLAAAVMHHLMLRNGIPLIAILDLLADLSTDLVVVEFIPVTDTMFRRMSVGREDLYAGHTRERFLTLCGRRFDVVESRPVAASEREMFVLRRRPG